MSKTAKRIQRITEENLHMSSKNSCPKRRDTRRIKNSQSRQKQIAHIRHHLFVFIHFIFVLRFRFPCCSRCTFWMSWPFVLFCSRFLLRLNTSRLRAIHILLSFVTLMFAMSALPNFLHNLPWPPSTQTKLYEHTRNWTLALKRAHKIRTESALRWSTTEARPNQKRTLSHHATFFRPVYFVALKHSPSKRKSLSKTAHQRSQDAGDTADAHRKCPSQPVVTSQPNATQPDSHKLCTHTHTHTKTPTTNAHENHAPGLRWPDFEIINDFLIIFWFVFDFFAISHCVFLKFIICKLMPLFVIVIGFISHASQFCAYNSVRRIQLMSVEFFISFFFIFVLFGVTMRFRQFCSRIESPTFHQHTDEKKMLSDRRTIIVVRRPAATAAAPQPLPQS